MNHARVHIASKTQFIPPINYFVKIKLFNTKINNKYVLVVPNEKINKKRKH